MDERIETETTECDGCGTKTVCAKLGPNGHYTLALCGACYPPLDKQENPTSGEGWTFTPAAS